ncbi:MAG: hypothetical protein H6706_00980 [Myxococcales bacterium]|nr:hypothetical protein [Myxococcales bacterium]
MKSIAAALFALLLPAAALAAPPTLDAVQTDPVLQPAAGAKASKGDNPAAVQTDPVLRRAGGAADGVAGRLAQMKAGGEAWSGRLDRHVAKGKHPLATDLRKLQSAVKSLKKGKRSLAQAAAMARLEAGLADFEGAVDADAADRALGQVRGALSDLNP